MNGHLTEWDMLRYAEIHTMTPENVAFVARVNCHVFECEKCKRLLDMYCEQAAQPPINEGMTR